MKNMWKGQLILILCTLYVRSCFSKTLRSNNIGYDHRAENRRHPLNRESIITTTPRPLLQKYWHSFVRNLPTLRPIAWNITNPIGTLFNAGPQVIKTPMTTHFMSEKSGKRKIKTNKRNSSRKKIIHKESQSRNYYTTYNNGYQQTQMLLQPLGLDYNGVMHFYEPSSGRYYALQAEAQPQVYQTPYGNQYNNQPSYQYNQHNAYNSYDEDEDVASIEDDSYYPESAYNFEHRYDNSENSHEYDTEYDTSDSEYDNEDEFEYNDSVELVDNWGYNEEEIFADRKLKGTSNNLDGIAGTIIKIQKQLVRPETAEDVKLLLPTATKNETKGQEAESVRTAFGAVLNKDGPNRRKQMAKLKTNVSRKLPQYYLFPANFYLQNR